ncbi:MAG TPA: tRNA (N6-threonylcarbamoyladenosine(37)-N6)-methyltransferase TrmO [Herpetosiphonaceae bacterium]|nr:tRNA (N6-threonylcarbamoyladenosine(37)-N6)-methyltransferase TrmO [Herpetosiphonaceae bacterium]
MITPAPLKTIGVVRSPLTARESAPKQGHEGAPDAWLEIAPEFAAGLDGLAAGQEIVVVTWLHQARRDVLAVRPRDALTAPLTGVFATRSAERPNPLGIHRVRIRSIDGARLLVGPLEAIDGTPIVDIKPELPAAEVEMRYAYPELLPLLKVDLDVPSYLELLGPLRSSDKPYEFSLERAEHTDYWQRIPTYAYAHCPFCEIDYSAPLDTYTLWHWRSGGLKKLPYGKPTREFRQCEHFLGIHQFLHLHDHIPEQAFSYFPNHDGEVPFITPWFFADDLPSFAVLSALPICRILENQFVPAYTAWILSYFCVNPTLILDRHYEREAALYGHDREYWPQTVWAPGSYYTNTTVYNEELYDLTAWCRRGQLGWLDHTRPDLPLRIGEGLRLPDLYTNIQGDRRAYVYRNGAKGWQ